MITQLDLSKAIDTGKISTPSSINYTKQMFQTLQSNSSQTTSKDAKASPYTKTSNPNSNNSKLVFPKEVYYLQSSSICTPLTFHIPPQEHHSPHMLMT